MSSSSLNTAELVKHMKNMKNIVILSGAGVSVSSDIPDYRGKNGIYSKITELNIPYLTDPEDLFTRSFVSKHPEVMKDPRIVKMLEPLKIAKPGISHELPLILVKFGLNVKVITQNIDDLYSKIGMKRGINLIEFHGSTESNNVILYGDDIPDEIGRKAYDWTREADMIIVMGTSLKVRPFAALANVPRKECIRVLVDVNTLNHHTNKWNKPVKNYDDMNLFLVEDTCVEFYKRKISTLRTEWGSKSNSRKYKTSYIYKSECDTWSSAIIDDLRNQ